MKTLATYTNIAAEKAKEDALIDYDGKSDTATESPNARKKRYDDQYARNVEEQGVTEGKIWAKDKQLELDKADVKGKQATKDAEQAASDGATAKTTAIAADLKVVKELMDKAKLINDRAQARVTFYKQYTDEADAAKKKADKVVTDTE